LQTRVGREKVVEWVRRRGVEKLGLSNDAGELLGRLLSSSEADDPLSRPILVRVHLLLLPSDGSEESFGARFPSDSRSVHPCSTARLGETFYQCSRASVLTSLSLNRLKKPYNVEQLTSALKLLIWAIVHEGGLDEPTHTAE
jgi:hypothetical protein